jgi:hypothetical protein
MTLKEKTVDYFSSPLPVGYESNLQGVVPVIFGNAVECDGSF